MAKLLKKNIFFSVWIDMEEVCMGEGGGGSSSLACDGLTYTQLLDHGYGLTSNNPPTTTQSFNSPSTPSKSQVSAIIQGLL